MKLFNFHKTSPSTNYIMVIGVGGGGCNAANHMYSKGIKGVDFVVCNTDDHFLVKSIIPKKVQLGITLTEGLGAGAKPEVGCQAAIESLPQIEELLLPHIKMVFITAGMGGGTGTGAAPIIAKAAKDKGILTIGIVSAPFSFEGKPRYKQAIKGIGKLKENVDASLVIKNDILKTMYKDLTVTDAFAKADNILTTAAKGIAEIMTFPGDINVDFEDVNTVMRNSGTAIMGTGIASGTHRARTAIERALHSPLLADSDISDAKNILINITSDINDEATVDEIHEIQDHLRNLTGNKTDLIMGISRKAELDGEIRITVIIVGF